MFREDHECIIAAQCPQDLQGFSRFNKTRLSPHALFYFVDISSMYSKIKVLGIFQSSTLFVEKLRFRNLSYKSVLYYLQVQTKIQTINPSCHVVKESNYLANLNLKWNLRYIFSTYMQKYFSKYDNKEASSMMLSKNYFSR